MLRCEFFEQLQKSSAGLKYLEIVENARKHPPEERGEVHHIYPRSFEEGKIDDEENLVRLSVRDHLLCHYYLAQCFTVPETCHAFRMMWDLHSDVVDQEKLFECLDEAVKLRKLGRIKSEKTLQKQRDNILGRVVIQKDGKERKIYPEQLSEFEKEGWKRGRAIKVHNPSKGRIWVHLEKRDVQILPELLDSYLKQGYVQGRAASSTKGKFRMSKGNTIKYATSETFETLKKEGYQQGVKIPRVRVEKEGKCRYVKIEDIDTALDQGWVRSHSFHRS